MVKTLYSPENLGGKLPGTRDWSTSNIIENQGNVQVIEWLKDFFEVMPWLRGIGQEVKNFLAISAGLDFLHDILHLLFIPPVKEQIEPAKYVLKWEKSATR